MSSAHQLNMPFTHSIHVLKWSVRQVRQRVFAK